LTHFPARIPLARIVRAIPIDPNETSWKPLVAQELLTQKYQGRRLFASRL